MIEIIGSGERPVVPGVGPMTDERLHAAPHDVSAAIAAFHQRDFIEGILAFATIPPLDFKDKPAVPIAEAGNADAVREMEAAWEDAWGRPLAASA